MRALEIIGPFKGSTGHDRHTREFTRHLVRRGVPVQLTHLDGWSVELPAGVREPWFDGLSGDVGPDVALHFTMPTLCRPRAGKRNVNYTMFEADRLPRSWAACAAMHERIVVPTRACFDTWTASGIAADRIRIAPFGVDGDFFSEPAEPLALQAPNGRPIASYTHRFLNIGDLRPRKNHLGLLRTWIRATRPDDDAVLVVKLSAEPSLIERFIHDLAALQQRLGRTLRDAAPVLFLSGTLSELEMRSLYRSASCYFSMSCGEGWDFPMTESAAAGLHLIAPRHSAYCEYLEEDEAVWIPAQLVPAVVEGTAGAEDRLWFDGTCWWRPEEDAAVSILRGILDGRVLAPSPHERIRRTYRWDAAAARLHEILDELP